MHQDVITFTKRLAGIDDLVSYIINYIDQNMILYNILCNVECSVTKVQNDPSTMIYRIEGVKGEELNSLKTIPSEQQVMMYNVPYQVTILPDYDSSNLIIKISVT